MSVPSPLRGRTAVVTGAARGLGAGAARELVRRGARVALLGLEEDELAGVAAALPEGSARWWAVDVTDAAAMEEAAARVRSESGRPSVVIGNAGIAEAGPFRDSAPDSWRRVLEVNVVGSAVTARAFLPDLVHTRGYYLQISSLAAFAPAPLLSAYCTSKAAAEAFAQVLRAEVAHRGVGVGIAYLSWADTGMIRAGDTFTALHSLRTALPWPAARIHPSAKVAERLVQGVERRSTSVYVQPWLRGVRYARPWLPPLVVLRSRKLMRSLDASGGVAPTGHLGPGGRAATEPAPGED